MAYIFTLVYAFLLFFFMIIIHEFGHFIVSKFFGVKVHEFAIGMGPALWKKQKGETEYSLRLIPIGGYCRLEGEDDFEKDTDKNDPASFLNQSIPNKILILCAGSLMNLLLCIVILCILCWMNGFSFLPGIVRALAVTGQFAASVFVSLKMVFSGLVSSDDVMGVVGIAGVVSERARMGAMEVSFLMGLLSANLAVMNMLPFPALDGGRIFLLLIKWVSRGRLSDKAEAYIHAAGMILLLLLMFFLIVKDTINLF
ncbi:MAG: site-2 protease family protein [Firmicutes bacterium]|nr:site-2 protease family protein [Bacillota bacterium]